MLVTADEVMTAVAALKVNGIKDILDLGDMAQQTQARDCPVIYPRPDLLVRNLKVETLSFGAPSVSKKKATYTIGYAYLYARVGEERGLYKVLPGMLAQWEAFVDALTTSDTLQTDVLLVRIVDTPVFDVVKDAMGTEYHGGYFSLSVLEEGQP
jgi:hypothetical protein